MDQKDYFSSSLARQATLFDQLRHAEEVRYGDVLEAERPRGWMPRKATTAKLQIFRTSNT